MKKMFHSHDATVLTYDKHIENRGSIYTIYDKRDFQVDFVQDKVSRSHQGVIRGFHGDSKTWKLITCLYGKIKLVTYDIYRSIKTEHILDGDDKEQGLILVPPNTLNAHQCLSHHCIFHYKWSEYYTPPEGQWSVYFDDLEINPCWDAGLHRIISERDSSSGSLSDLRKKLGISK